MNRYLCTNCGRTFEAPRPMCEPCEIDPLKDRRMAGVVLKVEIVHYDPPSKVKHRGLGVLACDPKTPVHGKRATGEPHVVNCAACRKTEAWLKAAGEDPEFMADQDHFVDPASVQVQAGGCC